jgi:hypothetical protein
MRAAARRNSVVGQFLFVGGSKITRAMIPRGETGLAGFLSYEFINLS